MTGAGGLCIVNPETDPAQVLGVLGSLTGDEV